jgi:hypothetical protein
MPQDGNGYDTISDNNDFVQKISFINTLDENNPRNFYKIRNYNKKETDKILIEKYEHDLFSYLKNGVDQSLWDWGINHCQDFADHAHHDCGPGMHNNSKDSDTVNALNNVLNDANNINQVADKYYNYYFNNIHINNQKNRVNAKTNYYKNQISIMIKECDKIVSDNKKKIKILTDIQNDAINNDNILNNNSHSLDNNLIISNDYSNYLDYRINIPKSVSTNNYEELYKAVILQNDIVQNTLDKVNNDILLDEKQSGFVSEHKSFIYSVYLKIMLFYYILVIGFIIFLIFINKEWVYYKKIIIAIISIIFPPLIFYIETFLYNVWLYILSMMSSSVYIYTELA